MQQIKQVNGKPFTCPIHEPETLLAHTVEPR